MRHRLEKPGSKRIAAGAGLFVAGALGYIYLNNHVPPLNPDNIRMDGVALGSCPSQHLGDLTVFYCQSSDGTLMKATYPTAELVNHGPFAAVENAIDAHIRGLAMASGIAVGAGMGLALNGLVSMYYGKRSKRQPAEDDYDYSDEFPLDDAYIPGATGYEPTEYFMHPEHGRIPLAPYGDNVPIAPQVWASRT